LLPEPLLRTATRGAALVPRYATARDEVWIRRLLDELDGLVGCTAGELEVAAKKRLRPLCESFGVAWASFQGVLEVIRRHYATRVVAAARPAELRLALFEQAAACDDRDEAVRRAAEIVGVAPDAVLQSLYADRPIARRLVAPERPPSPCEIVEQYNLELLQGLLLRSEEVRVRARTHVRSVVRFAKLRGLICSCAPDAQGVELALSGPLSLFRHTTKYGHALAGFFPALASTPGWQLEATCSLRYGKFVLRAGASDPVARTHALPRDTDSAVERRFAREVRRRAAGWVVERETAAVPAGTRMFFPDFTLTRGSARVLVEIVGYYTPEYLRAKLETLRRASLHNVVVCVDESLACSEEAVEAAAVVRYRRKVDVDAVLRAAEVVSRASPGS
jgi:predicted nuclease of restriction endonuclease-like RecB superfamily